LPDLLALGFEIEEFGRYSYQIRAVPAVLTSFSLDGFTLLLNGLLKDERKLKQKELIREELIMMSCKAAVKGGQALDKSEITNLLNMIKDEQIPLTCPHGRPIMLKLSKAELEKRFKRQV